MKPGGQRIVWISTGLLMAGLALFFVSAHYVMAYSDPNHWLLRAVRMSEGEPMLRRVPLFPAYLIAALKLTGPAWVFLANVPWLLLIAFAAGDLTKQALRDDARGAGIDPRWIALGAFVAGAMLLLPFGADKYVNRVVRLVNPYRDAGAMALLMLGFCAYFRSDRRARGGWACAAGVLFGLSAGFRETTLLACVPLGVMTLVRLWRERRSAQRWRWLAGLSLCGLLGLSPILIQNYLYSGYVFVPAYSARHLIQTEGMTEVDLHDPSKKALKSERRLQVENKTLHVRLDRLIPGMKFEQFSYNFPRAFRSLRHNFGGIGVGAILLAFVFGLWRRNRIIVYALLPAVALNLLFYSGYRFVKWRYLFVCIVLLLPLVGYGVASLTRGMSGLCDRWGQRRLGSCVFVGMFGLSWLLFVQSSLSFLVSRPKEMKAWEVEGFASFMQERLAEPRLFLGYYHHRELLAWLVDADFNRVSLGSEIKRGILETEGVDAAVYDMAQTVLSTAMTTNLYLHDMHHMPVLAPQWLEPRAVVSLAEAPVRPTHYARELTNTVYQLLPWTATNRVVHLPRDADGEAHVLLLGCRRLWDYAERTMAQVRLNGEAWQARLENGPNFFQLPAPVGALSRLEIISDAPLPDRPDWKLWSRNEELYLPLGLQEPFWFQRLLSPELKVSNPLRRDSCMLWDWGAIQVPVFADTNHLVYVELRGEFFQEDLAVRNQPHTVALNGREYPLPLYRQQEKFMVPLGVGTGALEMRPLELRAPFPAPLDQRQMAADKTLSHWRFVKFFDMRVKTLPLEISTTFDWDWGHRGSLFYPTAGFYRVERHLGKYPVRWTTGHGVLQLPLAPSQQDRTLTVFYFSPDEIEPQVEVRVNGTELTHVETSQDPGTTMWRGIYHLPAGRVATDRNLQEVVLRSTAWSPKEQFGSEDPRTLGLMFHRVNINGD